MALLWWDSFDHYATVDKLEKWGWAANTSVIGAYGRNGTNGMRLSGYLTGAMWIRSRNFGTPNTVVVGTGFMTEAMALSGIQVIIGLTDYGTYQLTLCLGSDGSLQMWRGNRATWLVSSDPGVIHEDVYYYIEFKVFISDGAGTVEVRVNEDVVINASGLDTDQTSNGRVTTVELGGGATSGGWRYFRYDDFYTCDSSGAQCNDFLGDIHNYLLMPEGAGAHADWTPLVGANWQEVDDNPPDDDTTYNASNTPADRDSFEMEDMPGGWVGTIHAVGVAVNSRRDDGASHELEPSVRSGGADYDGDAESISDVYSFYNLHAWELDPNTAAGWLVAGIDAMECGYELTV